MKLSSLSSKVLLFAIAPPLIIPLLCSAYLFNLQLESERALEQSVHARNVAEGLNRMRMDMYRMITEFSTDKVRSADFENLIKHAATPVVDDYEQLLNLTKNDGPGLRKAILDSRAEMRAGFDTLMAIQKSRSLSPEDDEERKPLWIKARTHLSHVLSNDLGKYAQEEQDKDKRGMLTQAENRTRQRYTVIALIIFSVLFSIFSAVYLMRRVTLRISQITDNAYRLASNRPLNQTLTGDDEIAQLDSTFHKMAEAMKEAENMRQEVVVMVTHDLRTPLGTLQNILRFLHMGNFGRLDEKGTEYIMIANRNVTRMANLVNDLLDIEKVKSGLMILDKQALDLMDCFIAAGELSGALADEAGVKIDLKRTELLVDADQDRITRVLGNLIANAIKFSPKGGKVTVEAKREGKWVHTSVSDEGPGIPANQLQQIFERFRQVEGDKSKVKGGSGLGLTICQAIVDLHGGKIWAENLPGKGSRFTFTLTAID